MQEAACQTSIDSASLSIEISRCSKRALGDLNGNDLIALGKREKPKWQRNESSNYLIMADSGLKVLNRSRQESK